MILGGSDRDDAIAVASDLNCSAPRFPLLQSAYSFRVSLSPWDEFTRDVAVLKKSETPDIYVHRALLCSRSFSCPSHASKNHRWVLNSWGICNFPLYQTLPPLAAPSAKDALRAKIYYTPEFYTRAMIFFEATRRKERSKKLLEHKSNLAVRYFLFRTARNARVNYHVPWSFVTTLKRVCDDAEACEFSLFFFFSFIQQTPVDSWSCVNRKEVFV